MSENIHDTAVIIADIVSETLESRIGRMIKKSIPKLPTYYTRKKTAELLSVTLPTLDEWTRQKFLTAYRLGTRTYYRADNIYKSMQQIDFPS